jgi:nucleoside-diphosphate-sugar epimerase
VSKKSRVTVLTGATSSIGKHFPKPYIALRTRQRSFDDIVDELDGYLKRYDVDLVHFAAVVGDRKFLLDPAEGTRINVNFTERLAHLICKSRGSTFHFVSSGHVYGLKDKPCSETDRPEPGGPYAISKYDAETRLINILGHEYSRLKIYRVFSVLGPGMNADSLYGALERIKKNNFLGVIRHANDVRDFMLPSQVAITLSKLLKANYNENLINICTGQGKTVRTACCEILAVDAIPLSKVNFDNNNSHLPFLVGNPTRLGKILEEIKSTIEYTHEK